MKLNYPNQRYDELLVQLRNEVNRDEIKIIENKIKSQLVFCCDFIVCFERYTTINIENDYTVKESLQERFSQAIDEDLDRLIILFTDALAYFKWREARDIDKQVLYITKNIELVFDDAHSYNFNGIVINPETDDIVIKNNNLDNWRKLKKINNALECKIKSNFRKKMIKQVKYYATKDRGINKVWIINNEQDFIYIIVDGNRNINFDRLRNACNKVLLDDYFMILDKRHIDEVLNFDEIEAIYDSSKEIKHNGY